MAIKKTKVPTNTQPAKAETAKTEVKEEAVKTAPEAAEVKAEPETDAKAQSKTAAKQSKVKEELKPEIYIQYQGQEILETEIIEKAKALYVAEGHRASSIKTLQVYIKPEEGAAYYVINTKTAGKIDLF